MTKDNGWQEYKRLVLKQIDVLERKVSVLEKDLKEKMNNMEDSVSEFMWDLDERLKKVSEDLKGIKIKITDAEKENHELQEQEFKIRAIKIRNKGTIMAAVLSGVLGAVLAFLAQWLF